MYMATIFISHSRKDTELVKNIKTLLENIGHKPIIEEFISESEKSPVPFEEVRKNVEACDFVLLFLTDNVVSTEYTKNWVIFEAATASAHDKRLYVFEREGEAIPYPIPYLTDYVLFSPENINDLLKVQQIIKETTNGGKDVATALAGAAFGSFFGPIGIAIGGIGGYLLGPKPKSGKKVTCTNCKISFNYYSDNILNFKCPTCRKPINL